MANGGLDHALAQPAGHLQVAAFHRKLEVAPVAGEKLIPAGAVEHHLDMVGEYPLDQVIGEQRRVIEGLIAIPGEARQVPGHRLRGDVEHLVPRAVAFGDGGGARRLIHGGALEAHRIGVEGAVQLARRQRHHESGIDAPGQQRAEAHVASQLQAHTVGEQLGQMLLDGVGAFGQAARHACPPIAPE